jgi:hypothetical protein
MVHIRGFLVLCGMVARVSGLVAEVRLGTRLDVAGDPMLHSDQRTKANPPSSAKPPHGARAGRSCGAATWAYGADTEYARERGGRGGWQMACVLA